VKTRPPFWLRIIYVIIIAMTLMMVLGIAGSAQTAAASIPGASFMIFVIVAVVCLQGIIYSIGLLFWNISILRLMTRMIPFADVHSFDDYQP